MIMICMIDFEKLNDKVYICTHYVIKIVTNANLLSEVSTK